MTTALNIALIISWLVFATTVMLMSPKWWLGFGIWGASQSNEYGSKKSLEHTFRSAAYISGILFVIICVLYPYLHG